MSANMAVATGDPIWEKRYNQFKKKLDLALKNSATYALDTDIEQYINNTENANLKLLEIEQTVFSLVRENRREDAQKLLNSDQYRKYKDQYAKGMLGFSEQIQSHLEKNLEVQQRDTKIKIATVTGTIAILAWILLLLVRKIQKLQERLAETNLNLEMRVEKRTEHLKKEIITRNEFEKENLRIGEILENSLNEIYVFDSDTLLFLAVNLGARNNLGYTVVELRAMTPVDIKPEYSLEQFSEMVQPLRDGSENTLQFITRHQRKDGSEYPAEVHLQLMKSDRRREFVALVIDITERQVVEERLRSTQFAVDNHADATYFVRSDARVCYVNKAACKMIGYQEQEILQMNVTDFDSEFPIESWPAHWDNLKNKVATVFESKHRHKSGHVFPVEIHTSFIRYGDEEYVWSFVHDITDRKKSEEDVKQAQKNLEVKVSERTKELLVANNQLMHEVLERQHAEEKLSIALNSIESHKFALDQHSVVAVTDPNGIITYANDKFCQISGYSREELLGQDHRIINSKYHSKSFMNNMWKTISSGEVWHGEFRNRKKDGEIYWVDSTLVAFKDEAGEIIQYVAIRTDITQQKTTEKSLETKSIDLKISLDQLKDVNLQLITSNKHQSRFISSMSHELRTPLNGILGFSSLLEEQTAGELNSRQMKYANNINECGQHLLDLINDLLYMSKIDSGTLKLDLKMINPEEVLHTAVVMVSNQIRIKDQQLFKSVEPNLPKYIGDKRMCTQIIVNLLSNSIKFTPDGGRLDLSVRCEENKFIRFEVTDSGIGIEKEEQVKIFSEFHQAEHVHDELLGGVGIGLALSRRLVELHNGQIGVESELGCGSKFWVRLPLNLLPKIQDKIETDSITVKNVEHPVKTSAKILVVEDNPINLQLLVDILELHDNQVLVATNGLEALKVVQQNRPDLIMMDIQMPVMGGLESTRKLKEDSKTSQIPIIALSASVDSESIRKTYEAGCDEFLSKPIVKKDISAILNKYFALNTTT